MLRLDPKDASFAKRLNDRFQSMQDKIDLLQKERLDFLKAIPPSSIEARHLRNRGIKLDSSGFVDETLVTKKIAPEAIIAEKIKKGSLTDELMFPNRGLTRFDSFGPFNVNVPNGTFEALLKDGADLRPNFWGIKAKGGDGNAWNDGFNVVFGDASLIGTGTNAVQLSGSGVKTLESDFLPIPELRLIQIYVRWQADSNGAPDNFTARARFFQEDKVTEVGAGLTFISKQAGAVDTDQVDRGTVKSPANARWIKVELEKATADFVLTLARIDLKELSICFRVFQNADDGIGPLLTGYIRPDMTTASFDPFGAFDLVNDYMQVPVGWAGTWEFTGAIFFDDVVANGRITTATLRDVAPGYAGFAPVSESAQDEIKTGGTEYLLPISSGPIELQEGDRIAAGAKSQDDGTYTLLGNAAGSFTWFSGRFIN